MSLICMDTAFLWSYYGKKSECMEKTHIASLAVTNYFMCHGHGQSQASLIKVEVLTIEPVWELPLFCSVVIIQAL